MRPVLFFPMHERVQGSQLLQQDDVEDFFLHLSAKDKAKLALALPLGERKLPMKLLAPDDAVDVVHQVPNEEREGLLSLLDDKTRREVKGLVEYAEQKAQGLINPRYARLRPQMSIDEAVNFLRRDAQDRAHSIYYAYVTDSEERLLGVVTFRDLLIAAGDKPVQDVMRRDVITVPEHLDQTAIKDLLTRYNLQMIPVVDSEKRIKSVVTKDQISQDDS